MSEFKGISEAFVIKQKHEFQKQLFWPNLKNGPFNKFMDPVCCVKFCQGGENFAMASGFQVEIRDPTADNAVLKNFHRFKSPIRSLGYKSGALLAVGETSGLVSVYSVAMRSELRKMSGHHTAPVTGLAFLAGAASPRLASCAEDGRCLLWDVADPQGQPLNEFLFSSTVSSANSSAASDKATALDASLSDCNLIACGLSNGCVALFDTRQPNPALIIPNLHCATTDDQRQHHQQQQISGVSAIRLAPGDNALYIAGDCWVRAVSLHQGGRQIAAYRRHHKMVTDLAVGRGALVSCGLDGMVKVTDLLTFDEVHKYEYPNSGLISMSLCLRQGDSDCRMALGTSDNWLLTRQFEDPATKQQHRHGQRASGKVDLAAGIVRDPYLRMVRADRARLVRPEDAKDESNTRRRWRHHLRPVDRLLKTFRHSDALSLLLTMGYLKRKPHTTLALARELSRRGALATALAGRSDADIARLLKFVLHSLGSQEMTPDAVLVAWDLVELYAGELGSRPGLYGLFARLRSLLDKEIRLGGSIMASLGRIDLLLGLSAGSGARGGDSL